MEKKNTYSIIAQIKKTTVRKRIVYYYFFFILVSTFLFASGITNLGFKPMHIIDAFFTASSAFSDTGLSVISQTHQLNYFGHIITLILMQVGGIGVMAFKVIIFVMLGQKLRISDRVMIFTEQGQNSLGGMVRLIKVSMFILFAVQFILMILLTIHMMNAYDYSFFKALWFGIYYAISSVNSAGYDLTGTSFMSFSEDYLFQTYIMIGIIVGGLGFPVLYDGYRVVKAKLSHSKYRVTLFTKVSLISYFATTIVAVILVLFIERDFFIRDNLGIKGFFYIVFQVVSFRSAGFQTIPLDQFRNGTQLIIMLLMFIGVSPVSTGGGIRTTTIAVVFLYLIAFAKNKRYVEVFNRRLSDENVENAFLVIVCAGMLVVGTTLSLLMQSNNFTLLESLFEAISAFGTIGLSHGVTLLLNPFNKILIAVVMIIGRIGILGSLLIFTSKKHHNDVIKLPVENITIG